jgi:hypothetical protein
MSRQASHGSGLLTLICLTVALSSCGSKGVGYPTKEDVIAAAKDSSISCEDFFHKAMVYSDAPLREVANDSTKSDKERADARKLMEYRENRAFKMVGEADCDRQRKEWARGDVPG